MSIKLLEVQTETTQSGNEISMIKVEGGKFDMGGNEYENEQPIHKVELNSFWLGQYQVQQELWTEIMGENPSDFSGKNLPVENVSWDDIQLFLEKLNRNLELSGDRRYRLPREAEWEYAARGGYYRLDTTYSGSENLEKVGWYWKNNDRETQEMGMKVPNELGLYDLSGNVFEWCEDWYDSYSVAPLKDPKGPEEGHSRVLRGGSWNSYERYCRVSDRNDYLPGHRYVNIGFRLSRTAW